jgi:hypothetical protein
MPTHILLVAILALLATLALAADSGSTTAPASGKPMFEDSLGSLDHWVSEGPHVVEIDKGHLHIKTVDDEKKVGQYVWCKQELPADFRVEFDMTPVSDSGFFLIFFCTEGVKGEDILGPELFDQFLNYKTWKQYQDWDKYTTNRKTDPRIRCYHTSYRRSASADCNLRKNPGLNLLKGNKLDSLLPKDKVAHVVLTKQGGHIHLDVNGQEFMDYIDATDIYSGGRFGFRQVYEADGYYSNFKMFDLTPAPAAKK